MLRLYPTASSMLLAATFAASLIVSTRPAQATPRARHSRLTARQTRKGGVALHPVMLPDGSGTIYLPAGWHIGSASKGMVSAVGPEGTVDLGIWCPVYTPQAVAMMYGVRPPLVASYSEPARVVQELMPQLSAGLRRLGQPGARWVRLIEQTPAAWPNGRGAYLHFETEVDGHGRWQTVALVLLMPNADGSYVYYTSSVSAPSARFARSFPLLLQIWSHWKVADSVYQERLNHAMESMRETGRIIRETNTYRQQAQDRSNRAWDLTIRGHWVYEDTETGERREIDHSDINKRVEQLNHAAGYERYKVVPYHNLNR
jgi:hypothetical protein